MERKETVRELFNRLDSTTYNHSVRVMALAAEYEDFSGLNNRLLSQAALVHDLGKIYVSQKILDKIGCLTPLEHLLVDLHPYIGYSLLKDRYVSEEIARIVLYHHGFTPPVLTDIDIQYINKELVNYSAVILRTLDAFEALTSDRPYHRGVSAVEAVDILKAQGFDNNDGYFFLAKTAYKKGIDQSAVLRGGCLYFDNSVDEILNDWERTNCA